MDFSKPFETQFADQKLSICEVGHRLYAKGFSSANDGNITMRAGDGYFLCTPTMQSKGSLKPNDIVLIDCEGELVAGAKQRSSEALLHLEAYRQRPDIQAVVHCHPPHATAFAITNRSLPRWVLAEVEIFLGYIPIAPYKAPGTHEFAETIHPFVKDSNAIILAHHGTLTLGKDLEQAFWWTEVLDSYCRILILASQIGPLQYFTPDQQRELAALQSKWGFSPPG
ncbi:MAG: class II aldolase/adducin family protein [Planctomycetota bacterium]|nr:class II aldolase/adducin family protein [Planctomycetota bacterium]